MIFTTIATTSYPFLKENLIVARDPGKPFFPVHDSSTPSSSPSSRSNLIKITQQILIPITANPSARQYRRRKNYNREESYARNCIVAQGWTY